LNQLPLRQIDFADPQKIVRGRYALGTISRSVHGLNPLSRNQRVIVLLGSHIESHGEQQIVGKCRIVRAGDGLLQVALSLRELSDCGAG
jgi:hypothetical protein